MINRLPRALALGLAVLLLLGIGPCGRLPGGKLLGDEDPSSIADWSFVNEAGLCALEVNPAGPHSVTVNCMAWQGRLFVSCSRCQGKTWSTFAQQDPRGRIKIAQQVHPVLMARVQAPDLLDAVWRARAAKLGTAPGSRPDHWWSFELSSRLKENF